VATRRPPGQVKPSEARYLSDLPGGSEGRRHLSMRDALVRCHVLEVTAVDELIVHGIHIATLRALEGHGLVHQVSGLRDNRGRLKPTLWRPTPRGIEIVTADEPLSLRLRVEQVEVGIEQTNGHALHQTRRVVTIEEPEPVDDRAQQRITDTARLRDMARKAGVAEQVLVERQLLAQSIASLRALAQACGVNIRDDLRVLTRRLDAIERKIAQQIKNRAA
jgi:hypothetical protein